MEAIATKVHVWMQLKLLQVVLLAIQMPVT
jgi:hypothetical protein